MRKNNKGFTLAELLIVVAIIAVLVAIAIPIFTSQLEKSRESTDAANLRDYYAEISVAILDGKFTDDTNVTGHYDKLSVTGGLQATYVTTSTGFTVTVSGVAPKQTQNNWQTTEVEVGGIKIAADSNFVGKTKVTYTYKIADAADGGNTYLTDISFS